MDPIPLNPMNASAGMYCRHCVHTALDRHCNILRFILRMAYLSTKYRKIKKKIKEI